MRRSRRRKSSGTLTGISLGGVDCSVSKPYLSAVTFGTAAQGSHVQSLQSDLKRWGYYTGSLDGVYGPKTREAVKLFQADAGITVDGIVGPETQGALCTAVENWTNEGEPFPNGNGGGNGNGGNGGNGGSGSGAANSNDYLLYGTAAAAGIGLAVLFARKRD
jgi:peptidoglycan hydrolase-like protein with peptidoglycan-binding domain